MRILYHHRTRATGADGNHIRQVADAFKKLGYEVSIISPNGVNIEQIKVNVKKNLLGYIVEKVRFAIPQFLFELLEIGYNIVHICKLYNLFKKRNFDFIYERHAIYNISGIITARRFGVPIVLEVSFTSKTFVIPERDKLLKFIAIKFDRFIFKNATAIIVVTEFLKNEVKELGVEENKIIVLPNAADPEVFNPILISPNRVRSKLSLSGKKVIGFIGGFYPWHGIDLLIETVGRISQLNKDAVVLIIGDGLLKRKMEQIVLEKGLKEHVIFIGRVPHIEIPEYIAAFDIGIMPDSNDYGSPMKILEYMAMGKPVVAPRLKPIEKFVTDGIHGLLFEKRNIDEICSVLINLLNDASLREKMGKAAREKVINEHTWVKNAECFLDFFKQLLKDNF